jgi:hypothetical protein
MPDFTSDFTSDLTPAAPNNLTDEKTQVYTPNIDLENLKSHLLKDIESKAILARSLVLLGEIKTVKDTDEFFKQMTYLICLLAAIDPSSDWQSKISDIRLFHSKEYIKYWMISTEPEVLQQCLTDYARNFPYLDKEVLTPF